MLVGRLELKLGDFHGVRIVGVVPADKDVRRTLDCKCIATWTSGTEYIIVRSDSLLRVNESKKHYPHNYEEFLRAEMTLAESSYKVLVVECASREQDTALGEVRSLASSVGLIEYNIDGRRQDQDMVRIARDYLRDLIMRYSFPG